MAFEAPRPQRPMETWLQCSNHKAHVVAAIILRSVITALVCSRGSQLLGDDARSARATCVLGNCWLRPESR